MSNKMGEISRGGSKLEQIIESMTIASPSKKQTSPLALVCFHNAYDYYAICFIYCLQFKY